MKIKKRELVKLIKEQTGDDKNKDEVIQNDYQISPELLKFTRTLKIDSTSRIRLNKVIQKLTSEIEYNTNLSNVQEKALLRVIDKVFNEKLIKKREW